MAGRYGGRDIYGGHFSGSMGQDSAVKSMQRPPDTRTKDSTRFRLFSDVGIMRRSKRSLERKKATLASEENIAYVSESI